MLNYIGNYFQLEEKNYTIKSCGKDEISLELTLLIILKITLTQRKINKKLIKFLNFYPTVFSSRFSFI